MTAIVVIAAVLNVVLITYRIYQTRLSADWNDDAFLFYITAINSLERMEDAGYSGELRQFYYDLYSQLAGKKGMVLNISDIGSMKRVVLIAPHLRIDTLV